MSEAILVKLGGSLITDKRRPGTARREVIARLAAEIAHAAGRGPARLVLGHGSGSFGHVAAARHRLAAGIASPRQLPGVAATQQRAADLHRRVVAALRRAGAFPFSIAPSSAVVFAGGEPAAFCGEPLRLALAAGLLPVVYGDVVADRERGVAICATERVLALVAAELPGWGFSVRRAVWLGETAGLLDEQGRTVPRLSIEDAAALLADESAGALAGTSGTDVTGGMRLRLTTAVELAGRGIESLLADGREPGLLAAALAGEPVPGTVVTPG